MALKPANLSGQRNRFSWFRRILRIAGTGALFAIFGVGGILLATVIIPLSSRSGAPDETLVAQRWIQRALERYLALGTRMGLWQIESEGTEQLRRPGQLVIANHPTLLDVVLLLAHMPQADCVVKKSAWSNPGLRSIVTIAGYIPNDGGVKVLEQCAHRLDAGRSVILFPEGSRSPASGLHPFQRGATQLAIETGCPVRPVHLQCDPPALRKGQPWYALPPEVLHFSLRVSDALHANDYIDGAVPRSIAARRFTKKIYDRFDLELRHANA